jgi:hypothetical protein
LLKLISAFKHPQRSAGVFVSSLPIAIAVGGVNDEDARQVPLLKVVAAKCLS